VFVVCVCMCLCVCMYVCMCVCVCVCVLCPNNLEHGETCDLDQWVFLVRGSKENLQIFRIYETIY